MSNDRRYVLYPPTRSHLTGDRSIETSTVLKIAEAFKQTMALNASTERSNGSDQYVEARPFSSRNDKAERGPYSENMSKNIFTDSHQCFENWCPFRNKKTADDLPEIDSRSYLQDPMWRYGLTFQNEKTADDLSEIASRLNQWDTECDEWAEGKRSVLNKETADNFSEIGSRSNRRNENGRGGLSKARRFSSVDETADKLSRNNSRSNRSDEDDGWGSSSNECDEDDGWGSRSNRRDEDGGWSSGWGSRSNRSGLSKVRRFSSIDEAADKLSQNNSRSKRSDEDGGCGSSSNGRDEDGGWGSRSNRRDEDGGWSTGWGSRSNRSNEKGGLCEARRFSSIDKTTDKLSQNNSRSKRCDEDGGWASGWASRSKRSNENGGLSKGRRFSSNDETADKLLQNGSRSKRCDEDGGWGSRSNRSNENGGWGKAQRFSSNDKTVVKFSEDYDYFLRPHDEDSVWDEDLQIPQNNNNTISDDLSEIVLDLKKGESFRSQKDEDICTEWDEDEQVPQNGNKTITDDLPEIVPDFKKGKSFRRICTEQDEDEQVSQNNNRIKLWYGMRRRNICIRSGKDRQISQNVDETIAELPEIVSGSNESENISDESREHGCLSEDYEIANDKSETDSPSKKTENIHETCDEDERSSQNNETPANYRSDMSTSELLTSQEKDYERKYNRRELADYGENEDYYEGCRGTPDSFSDLVLCPPWKLKSDDTRLIIDFIDQFWDRIGQFISDPTLRLIRFNNILAGSPETRFLTYDVKEYINCCSLFKEEGGPEFRFVEKMLRSIFWPPELQMEIAREFAASRYEPDNKQMTKFSYVTFWYCKLMQIKSYGPEDPLQVLTDKMPEEFTRWIKMKYGKSYPDSICELCVWIRRFDVPAV